VERAVKRADAAYEDAEQAQRREPRENAKPDIEPTSPAGVTDADDENVVDSRAA
jgi:hypothetical protein